MNDPIQTMNETSVDTEGNQLLVIRCKTPNGGSLPCLAVNFNQMILSPGVYRTPFEFIIEPAEGTPKSAGHRD